MKRYGKVIKVKPEKFDEYKKLHQAVWPQVQALMKECNYTNYSIYHKDYYLFCYFEYTGEDFEADTNKILESKINKKWHDICMPCQQPLTTRKDGEWWADMEELFHLD